MGLRDFISRRLGRFGHSSGSGTEPRCDHYSFTHIVLRDAAFQNPAACVTTLASDNCGDYLNDLWDAVRQRCEQHQQPQTTSLDDILIHKLPIGPYPCALIEMPAPEFPTEAFFVALVLSVDLLNQSGRIPEKPLWYLTLENTESVNNEIATVIGEWSADGTHTVLGPGSWPNIETFTTRVRDIVLDRHLS